MNRTELRILRRAIKLVAHHNENLWWELKHQIWDFGYQTYYPLQGEYEFPAKQAVSKLPEEALQELHLTYTTQLKHDQPIDRDQLIEYYAAVMIEEIVRRAGIAGYRTVDW
ncbi:MAG: hypothetical protein JSR23_11155 [Proteobacteria bacterium]|nr:hypothetical protein [Pseudomonadota bacterium]